MSTPSFFSKKPALICILLIQSLNFSFGSHEQGTCCNQLLLCLSEMLKFRFCERRKKVNRKRENVYTDCLRALQRKFRNEDSYRTGLRCLAESYQTCVWETTFSNFLFTSRERTPIYEWILLLQVPEHLPLGKINRGQLIKTLVLKLKLIFSSFEIKTLVFENGYLPKSRDQC